MSISLSLFQVILCASFLNVFLILDMFPLKVRQFTACCYLLSHPIFVQVGAESVNLIAGDKPADVYSGIAAR